MSTRPHVSQIDRDAIENLGLPEFVAVAEDDDSKLFSHIEPEPT